MLSVFPSSFEERVALFILYIVMLYLYIMSFSSVSSKGQSDMLEYHNVIGYWYNNKDENFKQSSIYSLYSI